MQLEQSDFKQLWKDSVMVKWLNPPDRIGKFYVPANAITNQNKSRKAWKGEIVMVGPEAYIKNYNPIKGDIVWLSPVSKDCPSFEDRKQDRFVIVKAEDLIGLES
jgi:hypothetical protein